MTEGTVQRMDIDAGAAEIYAVAADLASYTDWAQGVKSVEILETNDEGLPTKATFKVDAMMKEITYTLDYEHDVPHLMTWTAIPGDDIREMQGSYEFTDNGIGTSVVYALRVDPTFSVPGFIRRQAEKTLIGIALRGLKQATEGG
jgi:uncharacterized membrane protein